MNTKQNTQKSSWDIIIIGGGQAGLAMGYQLKLLNKDFVILDSSEKVGDSWRLRWDSLRLFTPAWTVKLPGLSFPAAKNSFPTKDEIADFLQHYVDKFQLPVLTGNKVTHLSKTSGGYEVITSDRKFTCKKVVIATGNYSVPKIPAFAADLNLQIHQMPSSAYKRPSELPDGDVLVAGAGTSGLQIAQDLALAGKKVFVSGTPPDKIPVFLLNHFRKPLLWMMNNMMTIHTKAGRKMQHAIKNEGRAAPLINISLEAVKEAGVQHIPRVIGSSNGYPMLADKRIIQPSSIIWCTGFSRDFSWISGMDDIADEHSYPITSRGISIKHKGLYFLGMAFQYALTSSWLLGVGRDAAFIADHIRQNP